MAEPNRNSAAVQPKSKATSSTSPSSASLSPSQEHSCEICGAAGLSDECMREHTRACHVEGSAQCPFCGLSGVAPAELLLHVNQAHLDYLTPENELMSFIDDQSPSVDGDSDSLSDIIPASAATNGQSSAIAAQPVTETTITTTMSSFKLNGGSAVMCSPNGTNSTTNQPNNGHSKSNGHQQQHKHKNGTQQTQITSFFPKSVASKIAAESPLNGGGSVSVATSNGGGSTNGMESAAAAANSVSGDIGTENVNGSQGSPLRSQLGLNLKTSNSPATSKTIKPPSPLQCPMCPYVSDRSQVLEEHINRSHFDPLSPSINNGGGSSSSMSSSSSSAASASTATLLGTSNNHVTGNNQNNHLLTALACPICARAFESAPDLELHVNIEHRDILSPAAATNTTIDSVASSTPSNGGAATPTATTHHTCPVCNISLDHMQTTQEMELHIEAHFPKSPQQPSSDQQQVDSALEKQAQKLREQREFEMLRAQYGMDDQGNFREQSAAGMQRAVYAGEMSVADYYERQVGLRAAESHGIDDGTSCTRSVAPRVATLSASSPNVIRSLVCSAVDHYASSYGDKGWGCGYRNLQMLLSSLLQNTTYNEALYSAWGNQGPSRTAMPSISRLQKMVEAAWAQGFDVQGSEQLGCKLHNTRKWIGATEVVTVLSWLRINCQLIDFHRPTSADGRHPDLFSWVERYFEEPKVHSPPLYLQHQGHSRTIIGIELRANGPQLLILDPSHGPRQVAALGSSQDSLRLIRRGSAAMRAPQYQIVAIKGLIETEEQYQASKVLRSLRIPADC